MAVFVIVLWFLWVQVQFRLGQVITNRAGERYICLAFVNVGLAVKH